MTVDAIQTVRARPATHGARLITEDELTRVEAVVKAAQGLGNPSTAAQLMRLRRALARLNPTDPNGTPTESNSWDPTEAPACTCGGGLAQLGHSADCPTEAPDEGAMLAEGGRDASWGTTP